MVKTDLTPDELILVNHIQYLIDRNVVEGVAGNIAAGWIIRLVEIIDNHLIIEDSDEERKE